MNSNYVEPNLLWGQVMLHVRHPTSQDALKKQYDSTNEKE